MEFDGAETCELVGLYMLSQLEKLGIDIGLYRDDGLATYNKTPRQTENIKKENMQNRQRKQAENHNQHQQKSY